MSRYAIQFLAVAVVTLTSAPASAQSALLASLGQGAPAASAPGVTQVVSANPFGLLISLFNTEYERRVADATTVGVGGSTAILRTYASGPGMRQHRERYMNGDVFVRYYPGGQAFSGFSFDVKAGVTAVPNQGTFFGVGFDVNQSLVFRDRFYVGAGIGLKRLIGTDEEWFDVKHLPTLRMNVGLAF